jgi:hypothetical protein
VLSCDIQNAYLNAPTKEKVWTTAGKEFGSREGMPVLIVRALYGLRGSGAAFRNHLAQAIGDMGFKASLADPDVWMRPAVKPDGSKYWEYLATYVDDVLCLSLDPKGIMTTLEETYTLKKGSVGPPTRYLGATVKQWTFDGDDDKKRWGLSSEEYVQLAIKNVETELEKIGKALSNKVTTPMPSGYRPELDVSQLLGDAQANYYQNLMGVLRWAVELGRIDINFGVSCLARHLVMPRAGHLQATLHMFAFLKKHKRCTLVFDETVPDIDERRFKTHDWFDFYGDVKEAIPLNAPEPRGKGVTTNCFVDADHAGDRLTRRSQTGVLIFVNRAPILWFSKRQNTVETSTFGSEFIAMKIAVELIEGLRYKLRMFGIPIDGPTNVFCDNMAVVKNTSAPESPLKKKHMAISYHRVREACAAGTIRITKEHTKTNLADILTKNLPGPQLHELSGHILY